MGVSLGDNPFTAGIDMARRRYGVLPPILFAGGDPAQHEAAALRALDALGYTRRDILFIDLPSLLVTSSSDSGISTPGTPAPGTPAPGTPAPGTPAANARHGPDATGRPADHPTGSSAPDALQALLRLSILSASVLKHPGPVYFTRLDSADPDRLDACLHPDILGPLCRPVFVSSGCLPEDLPRRLAEGLADRLGMVIILP